MMHHEEHRARFRALSPFRRDRGRIGDLYRLIDDLFVLVEEQAEEIDRLSHPAPILPARLVASVGAPEPK